MRMTLLVLALGSLAAAQAAAQSGYATDPSSPEAANDAATAMTEEVPPAPPGLFHSTLLMPRAAVPEAPPASESTVSAPSPTPYPGRPARDAIARPYWSSEPAATEPAGQPAAPQPDARSAGAPATSATARTRPAARPGWPGWGPGWRRPGPVHPPRAYGYPPVYGPAPYGHAPAYPPAARPNSQ